MSFKVVKSETIEINSATAGEEGRLVGSELAVEVTVIVDYQNPPT